MIKNKKFTLLQGAAILMIGGLVIVGVTLAIIKADLGSKVNSFSSKNAKVNVAVVENDSIEDKYEINDGLTLDTVSTDPNNPTKKKVAILNYDKEDYPTTNTYVRVRLVPAFVYDDGNHQGETVAIDLKNKVKYNLASDTNWVEQEIDGEKYYFYKNAIAPDVVTDPLLESVYYDGEVPENAHFELQVLVDGVSANSSGNKFDSAVEAWNLQDAGIVDLFTNKVEKK